MLERLSIVLALLSDVVALVACDASDHRQSGGRWYYGDGRRAPQDPPGFTPLDDVFARDRVSGYCRGVPIDGSDGATFAVVSHREARDRAGVYHCNTHRDGREYGSIQHLRIRRIEGADAASCAAIGNGHARDRHRVYEDGVPFEVREPATFKPLQGGFGRDARRGYFAHEEIEGSDGPGFTVVDERDTRYARDGSRAYYGLHDIDAPRAPKQPRRVTVRVLRGADPAAVRVLGRDDATDVHRVWYQGLPLAGADAASFVVDRAYQAEGDARDRSGVWGFGKRVAATAAAAA